MFLRFLDRFEEILISTLMALAVIVIFVAIVQRASLGLAADFVVWTRTHNMGAMQDVARSIYKGINGFKLTWAQEACIYLFVWMAKFGAAYGVRIGIHVGVDTLVQALHGRARKIVTIIAMSGGIVFTAIIAWIGASFVHHIYEGGQTSPDLEMKMWIIYLAVPLGSALMCFRFIQALYLYVTTGYIAHHNLSDVDGLEENAEVAAEGKA